MVDRCADSEVVAAWISGRLDPHAQGALEAHADRCEACLQLLAAVGKICADPKSRRLCETHGAPLLADWALLDAVMPAAVSRYALRGILGRGGFGIVYDAFDCELNRPVAIKALVAGRDDEALRAEARALAALSHPNVVQVYDVVATHGRVFLVMERVHGRTLRECDATSLRTLDHYLAAAAGILAIHEAGLVHADIKPDNLMLADDGRVLVTDFGLSRIATRGASATGGTPRYMAPEQKRGVIDARADQYAFCVALSEALHGAPPGQRPIRTSPKRVRAVLARGMHEDPAQRWPSMTSLIDALRDATQSRAGLWPVALVLAAATATLPWIAARPTAAIAAAPEPAIATPVAPAEASAAIATAVAQRNAGDLTGAIATLDPVLKGDVPSSALLSTRARHELGRTLDLLDHEDARSTLVDAHDAAVAQRADLLAASISIDLAIVDAQAPASAEAARAWLRTAQAELRRTGADERRHGGLALAGAEIDFILGNHEAAHEGFARATELLVGDDVALRVRALVRWSRLLAITGDYEQGLANVATAAAICASAGLDRSVLRVDVHRITGTLQQYLGRFDEAIAEAERALALADTIEDFSTKRRSALHSDLGVLHMYAVGGDGEAAERHLLRAVELAPQSWSAQYHLAIFHATYACRAVVPDAECEAEAGERARARQLRAVELARDSFGDDHPTFVSMRANLARMMLDAGDLERARPLFEQTWKQLAAHYGDDAEQAMQPLYGLLETNVRMGRRADAAEAARRLLVITNGEAMRGRPDVVAALSYTIGKTLAWANEDDREAKRLLVIAKKFFGDAPHAELAVIDAWFEG